MLEEFKSFIAKGNVVELAVGLIMALYFGAIVKSFVDHIVMPPVGMLLGGVDFSDLKLILQAGIAESAQGAGDGLPEVAIAYGNFINTIITFFIVALAVFMVVKAYNNMKDRMKKEEVQEPVAGPVLTNEEKLLIEIRDLLKK